MSKDSKRGIAYLGLWLSFNVLAWHFGEWGWLFLIGSFLPTMWLCAVTVGIGGIMKALEQTKND